MLVRRKYVVTVIEEEGLPPMESWLHSVVRVETIFEVPEGYKVEVIKEVSDGHETVD